MEAIACVLLRASQVKSHQGPQEQKVMTEHKSIRGLRLTCVTCMVKGIRSLKRARWGSSSSQGTMEAMACRAVRRTS